MILLWREFCNAIEKPWLVNVLQIVNLFAIVVDII